MSKFSYCQKTYPKTLLIGSDTVIVLLPNQVKQINIVWDHKRFLEAENSILNKTLKEYRILSYLKDSIINSKKETEVELIKESMRITQDNIDLTKENEELKLHLTKVKKNRKWWLIGGTGVGILTVILLN